MWVDLWATSTTKHSSARDFEGLVTSRWLVRAIKVKNGQFQSDERSVHSPYETPYFTKFVSVELLQSAREIVSNAYIVCIESEVTKGDVNREKRGR